MQGKCMAVIRGITFGIAPQSADAICATFKAYVTEDKSALLQLPMEKVQELIQEHKLQDISHADGRTIWVNVSPEGQMVYDKPCVIPRE